jgi:hypothetical protein
MSNYTEYAKIGLSIIAILMILCIVFVPDTFNDVVMSKFIDTKDPIIVKLNDATLFQTKDPIIGKLNDATLFQTKDPIIGKLNDATLFQTKDPILNSNVQKVVNNIMALVPGIKNMVCNEKELILASMHGMIDSISPAKCQYYDIMMKKEKLNIQKNMSLSGFPLVQQTQLLNLFDSINILVSSMSNKHFCKSDGYIDLQKIKSYLTNIINGICEGTVFNDIVKYNTYSVIGKGVEWLPN